MSRHQCRKIRLHVVKNENDIMSEVTSSDSVNDDNSEESSSDSEMLIALGLDEISDSELRGEDIDEDDESEDKDDESEDKDDESEDKDDESEDKDDESEDKDDESEDKDNKLQSKKPPKGYVPLQALKEARFEIKETKSGLKEANESINELKQIVSSLKEETKVAEENKNESTFTLLSDDEFEELAAEDPLEAVKYQRREHKYLQEQTKQEQVKQEELDTEDSNTRFIDKITTEELANMAKVVPGLFDEDMSVQDSLIKSANEVGFTSDMFYLTDPGTKIILRGETEPKLLGSQATSILKVLASLTQTKEPNTKDLETKLRKSIMTEMLTKFKKSGPSAFKSLTDAPKTPQKKQKSKTTDLSEREMAKLPEAELERYLSGEAD